MAKHTIKQKTDYTDPNWKGGHEGGSGAKNRAIHEKLKESPILKHRVLSRVKNLESMRGKKTHER